MQEAALGLHLEREASREGRGRGGRVRQENSGAAQGQAGPQKTRGSGPEEPGERSSRKSGCRKFGVRVVDDQAAELQAQKASPPSSSGAQ